MNRNRFSSAKDLYSLSSLFILYYYRSQEVKPYREGEAMTTRDLLERLQLAVEEGFGDRPLTIIEEKNNEMRALDAIDFNVTYHQNILYIKE